MPNPFKKAAHQRGNIRNVYQQTTPNADVVLQPFSLATQAGKHKFWNRHVELPRSFYLQGGSLHNDYTENQLSDSSAMNCSDGNGHWITCGRNGGVIEPPIGPPPELHDPLPPVKPLPPVNRITKYLNATPKTKG